MNLGFDIAAGLYASRNRLTRCFTLFIYENLMNKSEGSSNIN